MTRRVLLLAGAALAVPAAAQASSWWVADSRDGTCIPSGYAARITHDPAFASPFMLAAEMRAKGRLDHPIQHRPDPLGSAFGSSYAVFYDGMATMYFTTNGGCEVFLNIARENGDLP